MKTPVTQRSPCYSAVSALLMNPLPDRSNYSPLCHTHYLTPDQYFTSLFRPDPLPSCELHYILFHQWHIFLHSVSHHEIFFNNAFYKLVKTKFWCLSSTLRTWRNNGYIAGLDLEILIRGGWGSLGPSFSSNCLFVSFSIPLCSLSQSSLFSLSSFPLASIYHPFLLSDQLSVLKINTSCFIQLVYLAKHH